MSVYSELQAAVYAALVADSPLMGMVTAVYDLPPPDAVCPYLTLTPGRSVPVRTQAATGQQCLIEVTVHSAEAGFCEAEVLAAEVQRVLGGGGVVLPAAALVLWQMQTLTFVFDPKARVVLARTVWQATVQENV
jgi:Protein of unknown function (DUF3168)